MARTFKLQDKLLVFITLSALDLFLTWQLLHKSEGVIYESNPIASWWLIHTGWSGLCLFKAGAVFAVATLSTAIARTRPRQADGVLLFACTSLFGVLIHSSTLTGSSIATGTKAGQGIDERIGKETVRLDNELAKQQEYARVLQKVCSDLLEERATFASAIAQLIATDKGNDVRWLETLRREFPHCSDQERFAITIINWIAKSANNRNFSGPAAQRLVQAYEAHFGWPPPNMNANPSP